MVSLPNLRVAISSAEISLHLPHDFVLPENTLVADALVTRPHSHTQSIGFPEPGRTARGSFKLSLPNLRVAISSADTSLHLPHDFVLPLTTFLVMACTDRPHSQSHTDLACDPRDLIGGLSGAKVSLPNFMPETCTKVSLVNPRIVTNPR
jgi:hypothetical protein